jgi:outer membrane protein OmpA-like peptidoglycan-associated protein
MRIGMLTIIAVAIAAAVASGRGPWQTPGPFQTPSGHWQSPGPIQVPRGIQAVHYTTSGCTRRLTVGADALFAFDKYTLSSDANQTLTVLGPMIAKQSSGRTVRIDGYTDSIGSDDYNLHLSEMRARTVRDWLAAHHFIAASTPINGFGKANPVAPNTHPDGSDDPLGRQKNRRVEIVLSSCGR